MQFDALDSTEERQQNTGSPQRRSPVENEESGTVSCKSSVPRGSAFFAFLLLMRDFSECRCHFSSPGG